MLIINRKDSGSVNTGEGSLAGESPSSPSCTDRLTYALRLAGRLIAADSTPTEESLGREAVQRYRLPSSAVTVLSAAPPVNN